MCVSVFYFMLRVSIKHGVKKMKKCTYKRLVNQERKVIRISYESILL